MKFFNGSEKNVLERMYETAKKYQLDPVVRITHDDILIPPDLIKDMLDAYDPAKYDYVFASNTVEGIAPEIISFNALEKAYLKHKNINIEHISYFVKQNPKSILAFSPQKHIYRKPWRLALDYPRDHLLLEILSNLYGLDDTERLLYYISNKEWLLKINELPKITVFITCFNGSQYLKEAIESIRHQTYQDFEMFFVDDGSTDDSLKIAASYDFIKIIVNSKNEGISLSSNRVLEKAKGRYLLRLDADDTLAPHSLLTLYLSMEKNPTWAIAYSGYFETDEKLSPISKIECNAEHHFSGSLVSKKALNELKFKEGLKHYDSQEIFYRLSRSFDYGYVKEPLFNYRNHKNSWSRRPDNLEIRTRIKREMDL